jgi:hypothetical protein
VRLLSSGYDQRLSAWCLSSDQRDAPQLTMVMPRFLPDVCTGVRDDCVLKFHFW